MFQEGRHHLKPCVNTEIYSCISVHLSSAEFIFNLHLSIHRRRKCQQSYQDTAVQTRVFGKTNKTLPRAGPNSLGDFCKWSMYLLLIAPGWRCCLAEAGCDLRSQDHSCSVYVLFLLLKWIKCPNRMCETHFLPISDCSEDYSAGWQHPCGFAESGSLVLCHLYN